MSEVELLCEQLAFNAKRFIEAVSIKDHMRMVRVGKLLDGYYHRDKPPLSSHMRARRYDDRLQSARVHVGILQAILFDRLSLSVESPVDTLTKDVLRSRSRRSFCGCNSGTFGAYQAGQSVEDRDREILRERIIHMWDYCLVDSPCHNDSHLTSFAQELLASMRVGRWRFWPENILPFKLDLPESRYMAKKLKFITVLTHPETGEPMRDPKGSRLETCFIPRVFDFFLYPDAATTNFELTGMEIPLYPVHLTVSLWVWPAENILKNAKYYKFVETDEARRRL